MVIDEIKIIRLIKVITPKVFRYTLFGNHPVFIINKIDLAEVLEFDTDALVNDIREVDANIIVHKVSSKTKEGIPELISSLGLSPQ